MNYYSANTLYWGLTILGLIITLGAQFYVTTNYKKYKKVKTKTRLTGFEVARKILDKNGLNDIHVVEIKGNLTDHYDPKRKVVRLSSDIFNGVSIAANSVAAHECGHAIQDKDDYTFMRIRSSLVPIVNLSSKAGYIVIFIGIICNSFNLALLGFGLLLIILLFQLVTLPVEFDASKRAKTELNNLDILNKEEVSQSNTMLTSAALTYVASVVANLLELIYYALLIFGNNRD